MPDNIKRVILKYRDLIPENIFKRDLKIYKTSFDEANVIVGPRRAGKTFFLYSLVKKEKNPILINFEDNLLDDLDRKNLNKIPDISKELFEKESLSFFFDEMQTAEDWERFVITLLNEHYLVYITGSNSKLLSIDIATSLRGKSLTYLMLPLSFVEYLRFKNVKLEKHFEDTDTIFEIKKHFADYLKFGGFPEVVLTNLMPLKNKLINNYYDSVLYKDLIDKLNLKNIRLVEITMKYLLNLFGNIFSISAFEKYLQSNKIPYSLQDLYNILKSLQDVFMVSYVKEYSKSFKKSEYSKSKIYLFDTAYIHFLAIESEDYGRILENVVFIELFRREGNIDNKSVFYHKSKNNKECDFVIARKGKIYEAIQVSYELNEKNREREIAGLLAAMDFFRLEEGLILTNDQEEELTINKKKIIIKPVWKWLLGK